MLLLMSRVETQRHYQSTGNHEHPGRTYSRGHGTFAERSGCPFVLLFPWNVSRTLTTILRGRARGRQPYGRSSTVGWWHWSISRCVIDGPCDNNVLFGFQTILFFFFFFVIIIIYHRSLRGSRVIDPVVVVVFVVTFFILLVIFAVVSLIFFTFFVVQIFVMG